MAQRSDSASISACAKSGQPYGDCVILPGPESASAGRHRRPPDPAPQVSGPLQGGTADHTKFEELKGPFASGPEVTQACLGCHTETGKHFMQNIHWTWSYKTRTPANSSASAT
jgi:hypothetical protein